MRKRRRLSGLVFLCAVSLAAVVSGAPPDDIAVLKTGCEAGNAEACLRLGWLFTDGEGMARDPAAGTTFFEKAGALFRKECGQGEPASCTRLAQLYEAGSGVPKDLARAATLYEQGCTGKVAFACGSLALIGFKYERGREVPVDVARAAELYRQACDGADAYGCVMLGTLHEKGDRVELDLARAATLYTKGCDAGDASGCKLLGALYEEGSGVGRDIARATTLYAKACDGGIKDACDRLKTGVGGVGPGFQPEPAVGHVSVRGAGKSPNGLFLLRLRETDLADVFRILHELSSRGFVIDQDVKGSVSVDIESATIEEVLPALRSAGVTVGPGPLSRVSRAGAGPAPAPSRKYTGTLVSFSFKKGDLIDILRLFEDISGVRVRTTPVVNGRVSIFCVDVPWDQTLEAIAASVGRTARIESRALYVLPRSIARRSGDTGTVELPDAKSTEPSLLRSGWKLEELTTGDLKVVGVSRVGTDWTAYAYGPWRRLWTLDPGQALADGRVRSIAADRITFETSAGPVEVPVPR